MTGEWEMSNILTPDSENLSSYQPAFSAGNPSQGRWGMVGGFVKQGMAKLCI